MSYASVPPPHSPEQLAAGIAAASDFEKRHPAIAKQYVETHHRGGWPRIYPYDGWRARLAESWWVLTGRFTLHRAWQSGYDQHIWDDSARRANGGR